MASGKRVSCIINIIDTDIWILKKVSSSGQLNVFISTFNCFVKSNLNYDTHVGAATKKLLFTKIENSLKKIGKWESNKSNIKEFVDVKMKDFLST